MKIRIEHTSNPLNYGTNMMVTNFIYYISTQMKDVNFILDVYRDEDIENYKKQTGLINLKRQTIDYNFSLSTNFFGKVMNKIKREIFYYYFSKKNNSKLIESTEELIILGGDDLSEYYGIKTLRREFNRINSIKEKINVHMVGQTIGPFSEENITLAKNALTNVNIYSRDKWTTKYLNKKIGINNVINSSDLAFLDLPYQSNEEIKNNILKKYKLKENEFITIIPSGLFKSYCSDKSVYLENWLAVLNKLKIKYPEKKLVLLPHVLRDFTVDDRNIIRSLEESIINKNNIIFIYDEMMPVEARQILGNGFFTITGRMHGAISTFQMKKPAISISYSVKYEGIIGEGLNLPELIIDGKGDEKWADLNILDQIDKKVDFLEKNYNELVKQIDQRVEELKRDVEYMLDNIVEHIKRGKINE